MPTAVDDAIAEAGPGAASSSDADRGVPPAPGNFALRAEHLTRGPLVRLPKGKSGRPTVGGVFEAIGAIMRRGPKRNPADEPGADVLTDVSFTIAKGSIVVFPGADLRAIEVLMRILTASIPPTSGKLVVNGTIAGLLGVGENLEGNATGRESVVRERAYLGVPNEREEEFLAETLAFAGLKDFEDILVGRYSTGMSLRLGLSMIFAARPDIVVIGDIMGVGDLEFQERCRARIRQLAEEGVTFLLGGPAFGGNGFADRRMLVERARVTEEVVEQPTDTAGSKATHDWRVTAKRSDGLVLRLLGIRVMNRSNGLVGTKLRLLWAVRQAPCTMWPVVDFLRGNVLVFRTVAPEAVEVAEPGYLETSVVIPDELLAPVPYRVRVQCDCVYQGRVRHLRVMQAIEVVPLRPTRGDADDVPYLAPNFRWLIEPVEEVAI